MFIYSRQVSFAMASDSIQRLKRYECHFTSNLEEETIKNHIKLMNEINLHLDENSDMLVEALLFKCYLLISRKDAEQTDDLRACLAKVNDVLLESQDDPVIEGYQSIALALESYVYVNDEVKFESNICRLTNIYSKFENDVKFFASIHATKGFAFSKISVNRSEDTVDSYRKAVEACSENSEWLFSLGLNIWRKLKVSCRNNDIHHEFNEVESIFEETLNRNPEHNHAMLFLADIYKRKKNVNSAHKLLQRAVKIEKSQMYVCGFAAKMYREMKMYSEASDVLKQAEKIGGDLSSFVLHQFAQLYDIEGKNASCIRYFNKAIKADPCNLGAVFGLANTLEKHGEIEEANEHYELMLRNFDQDMFRVIQINHKFGSFLDRTGQINEAITKYEFLVDTALDNFQEFQNIGNNPIKFKSIVKFTLDNTIFYLRKMYSDQNDDITMVFKRAQLEQKLGYFEDAINYFHDVVNQSQDLEFDLRFKALCHLADIHIKMNESSEAEDVVRQMGQLCPDGHNVEIINTYKTNIAKLLDKTEKK